MLDRIIRASLRHRWAVLVGAFILLVAGGALTLRLPVDIFPDLTAPTVTVMMFPSCMNVVGSTAVAVTVTVLTPVTALTAEV